MLRGEELYDERRITLDCLFRFGRVYPPNQLPMKGIIVFVLAGLAFNVQGQDLKIQKEINDQVWKPFIEAFNNRQVDAFLNVHSKDVVRAPRDEKMIFGYDEYLTLQRNTTAPAAPGRKRTLELHFTERIHAKDQAIELGVYKTTMTNSQGNRSSFGKFMVVLRRENGVWKILVDTDSSEGGTVSEKDFLAAKEME